MLTSLLLLGTLAPQAAAADPARAFDFWIGTWKVQNRHLQADGTWQGGTTTRCRMVSSAALFTTAALLRVMAAPRG